MEEYVLKMPDVGEGVAEAELVEWHVKPGDPVHEDMVLAAVMTDKATVEIPSPVAGTVTWLGAAIGETVAVKAPLLRIATGGAAMAGEKSAPEPVPPEPAPPAADPAEAARPLAFPAVRRHAEGMGIDLARLTGSGPAGRVTHEDIERFAASAADDPAQGNPAEDKGVEKIKIAEKMALTAARIPHITYVEEIDVTDLESLRARMNGARRAERPKLTLLPFLMRALVKTLAEQPAMNATFDDAAGVISRYHAVHIGIATQTPAGLAVPVVRHAEGRGLWDCAAELARVSEAARAGTAQRGELSGSTITISSLGALGGIASTPLINHPEVAIIGVNKIVTRPVWDGASFKPRQMMNLSSSFDHRVVDGFDAAIFIQRIKAFLETPALIFIES